MTRLRSARSSSSEPQWSQGFNVSRYPSRQPAGFRSLAFEQFLHLKSMIIVSEMIGPKRDTPRISLKVVENLKRTLAGAICAHILILLGNNVVRLTSYRQILRTNQVTIPFSAAVLPLTIHTCDSFDLGHHIDVLSNFAYSGVCELQSVELGSNQGSSNNQSLLVWF